MLTDPLSLFRAKRLPRPSKKAGQILLGADRYDIFEKGQKAIREFVEELFRFLISSGINSTKFAPKGAN